MRCIFKSINEVFLVSKGYLFVCLFVLLSNQGFSQKTEQYKREDLLEVIKYCNEKLEVDPINKTCKKARGQAYFFLGELDLALGDYLSIYEFDSLDVKLNYDLGTIYNQKRMYEEAIKYYSTAIKMDSLSYSSYFGRGTSHFEMNNFDLAINDFSFSLSINPLFYNAYYNRALSYIKLEDYEMGAHDLNLLIKENYLVPQALANLGFIKLKNKQYEEALQLLDNGIKADPAYYLSYKNMALLYFDLNQNNEGCKYWKKAKELGMNDDLEKCE